MKKPLLCGSAAILMTIFTVSVCTTAQPRINREPAARVAPPKPEHTVAAVEDGRHVVKTAG